MTTHKDDPEAQGSPVRYKTENLALAGVLSLKGFQFAMEPSADSDKAVFVFMPITKEERDLLSSTSTMFHEGRCRVEPLQYLKEVARVRGVMYSFIDEYVR